MKSVRTIPNVPRIEYLNKNIASTFQRLKICFAAVFVFGLIAHGYGFLNFTINHDSLREVYLSTSWQLKISAGRFLQPLLRFLMGEVITTPWLTGLVGLLFLSISVYLLSTMFSLDTLWENILLSGICVTNVTVTAVIASYLHDFCGNMLALLLSIAAAYFWWQMGQNFSWRKTLLGALCLFGVLGIYQTYIGVTLVLIGLHCILDLLDGVSAKNVICRCLLAAPMGAAAVIPYTFFLYYLPRRTGIVIRSDVKNVTNFLYHPMEFFSLILLEYRLVIQTLFSPNTGDGIVQAIYPFGATIICIGNCLLFFARYLRYFFWFMERTSKIYSVLPLYSAVYTSTLPYALCERFQRCSPQPYQIWYLSVLLNFYCPDSARTPSAHIQRTYNATSSNRCNYTVPAEQYTNLQCCLYA